MSERVKVRIQTSQKIYYNQIVEMPRGEWEKLKAMPEKTMESESMGPISNLLELGDCSHWDDYDEPELTVVDDEGKAVKPLDCYSP